MNILFLYTSFKLTVLANYCKPPKATNLPLYSFKVNIWYILTVQIAENRPPLVYLLREVYKMGYMDAYTVFIQNRDGYRTYKNFWSQIPS